MAAPLFGKWTNTLPTVFAVGALAGLLSVIGGFWYWATPKFWAVGYMPTQPESGFSHQIHAGKLGMDCRYCHTNVEKSPEANIPAVATCYGCHAENRVSTQFARAENISFVREAYEKSEPIPWRRIHRLPDFVRNFPHHIHVNVGVSCFSCHGQITAMPIVFQAEPLSMGWCLDCHRGVTAAMMGADDPAKYLVPRGRITQLQWVEEVWRQDPEVRAAHAQDLLRAIHESPPANCGACHH